MYIHKYIFFKQSYMLMWKITGRTLRMLVLTLSILTGSCVYSQDVTFRHYSSDQGFTGAAFKAMVQDSLGFIWITSGSGLFKFDGYSFINYWSSISGKITPLSSTGPNPIIKVDPAGKVWVAFSNYIAWFNRDKNLFIPIKVSSGNAKTESMWFENENTLWMGVEGKGLTRLDISSGRTVSFLNQTEHHNKFKDNNGILSIADKGNSLLIGSRNGLWIFDKENNHFSRPHCIDNECAFTSRGDIKKIFLHSNYMWLWTGQQLLKLNAEYNVVHRFDLNKILQQFDFEKRFVDARIMGIAEDHAGKFWMASQGLGLTYYDPETNILKNYRNDKNDVNSIASDVLDNVMVDRDHNVWATTVNKGIVQLKKQSLVFYNYLEGMSSTGVGFLQSEGTSQFIVGTNGKNLWKSTYQRANISRLKFEPIEMTPPVRGFENIIELIVGKKNLWVGTMQAGAAEISFSADGKIKQNPRLFQHSELNNNTISDNFITSFWEDNDDRIWIGTFFGGLNIIDAKNYGKPGSVITYRHDPNNRNSLSGNGVTSYLLEEDGSLLVTTFGGLDRIKSIEYGYEKFQFEHLLSNIYCKKIHRTLDGTMYLTTKVGLYKGVKSGDKYTFTKLPEFGDEHLTYIQEDRLGRLWIMSFDGLFFYDRKKNFVLRFRKEDGLPSSRSVMAGSVTQTPDGIMAFANEEGLTIFDPLSLKINSTKPQPVITSLKINNEEFVLPESINTSKKLTLDHTHQILSVEFSAMDFSAPEKNIYRYKLEEFDRDWITTDWKNRTATYTNLKPGDYKFKVRASNRDGVWDDFETSLSIEVLPPPWKSWWAYTLYGITFLAILYLARKNIIQHERLASKLKLEHLELEKTQEVDRLRSTFFTNISHEFRTPLTLIQGPAQNMIEKLKKEKLLKANDAVPQLDLILSNSSRLLRLVNQVLDLSKLESGGLKKEISEEEIFGFLKMVIGHFTLLAVQKRISLNHHFPNQFIRARFDKDKLEKIVSNLVFNALKFTPENGSILITVRIDKDITTGSHHLLMDIKDSGVGIPPEQIDRIFERFFQVNEGDSQNAGAGIGLALSKELAEFLGGTLSVVSSPGVGSTFTLSLPLPVVDIQENPHVNATAPLALNSHHEFNDNIPTNGLEAKPLLLIVEDHLDLRKFICLCLGDEYEYLEAGNGKEALQLAVEQLPSLVLSDVMMPEMDGVELCNRIKQDHRTNHIPLILLTAKASEESKLQGLDKGADDYIIKPFNKDELVLKIRNQILAQKRMQEKIRIELLSGSTVINAVSTDEKFIAHVREIIEKRMSDEKLGVEALADEIGLSRVQLYRKITALTGISVNDFIRKLRLQKAAQLLSQNAGSIADVAYEVGFSNPSYFSKCFKDHFGVIPSNYYHHKV
jgi:signal transduction histidine kinase/CheY-like chemotaxis protein/AraC-like DNA-binding protein/ligand-binding sensor domain-containing protein